MIPSPDAECSWSRGREHVGEQEGERRSAISAGGGYMMTRLKQNLFAERGGKGHV